MRRFKDLSIKTRLILLQLLTASIVLVFSSCVLILNSTRLYRESIVRKVLSMAQLIGSNCEPALMFIDPDTAEETLGTLEAERHLSNAWLLDREGRLFVAYAKPEQTGYPMPDLEPGSHRLEDGCLVLAQRIVTNGKPLGTIVVRYSLQQRQREIVQSIVLACAVLIIGCTIAFALALATQRTISGPLLTLAGTVKQVSETKDFSLRVDRVGRDEIGILFDGFNDMLAEIRALNEELEDRVRQRTEELRSAMEHARAASEAKSQFVANMSHEIRTPLNAIVGLLHLLGRTDLSAKQRDYVSKISLSSKSLLHIINDILDFSKIEAGKLTMEEISFELSGVLDELCTLLQTRAAQRDIEVVFRTDPDLPLSVIGDPVRLEQVLINLADNAIKFTQTGEVVVSTAVERIVDDRVTVRFAVRDTGIGMSAEEIDRLFEAFTQADGSTTRRYGGTGLGLSICKRLVEMMGGELQVVSELGKGSLFSFSVELGLGDRKLRPAFDLSGLRVLVIDDNPTSRTTLREMLEVFEIEVGVAASGEEGIRELEKVSPDRPYHLVLMDWKMPGMNGIETSLAIKNHTSLTRIPTIIMVTAYAREEVMRQAEEAHLEGFLLKPVSPSSLFNTIVEIVGEPGMEGAAVEKPVANGQQLRGARILLAEDNEINQLVARELLETMGIEVTTANNGEEAIAAVFNHEFDGVLMDIQMPEMGGIEATSRIRADDRFAQLPIIAMTADTMTGARERYLAAGMVDHVPKPIDTDQLFTVLCKWVKVPERGVAVVQGQEAVDDRESLQDLEGIDTEAGLRIVRDKVDVYRKILVKFYEKYREFLEELERTVDAGETEDAVRMVHSLKGAAGNIGAVDLHAAASWLEQELRYSTQESRQLAKERLAVHLGEVLSSLQRLQL